MTVSRIQVRRPRPGHTDGSCQVCDHPRPLLITLAGSQVRLCTKCFEYLAAEVRVRSSGQTNEFHCTEVEFTTFVEDDSVLLRWACGHMARLQNIGSARVHSEVAELAHRQAHQTNEETR